MEHKVTEGDIVSFTNRYLRKVIGKCIYVETFNEFNAIVEYDRRGVKEREWIDIDKLTYIPN